MKNRDKKPSRDKFQCIPSATPSRAWWDVVTIVNAPSQTGYWETACTWMPEQWARDPLPTPKPPGMEGRSILGPWSADAPPAIVTRVAQRAMPICPDCLRKERGSYAALVESLTKLDPAALWDETYLVTGRFKPEHHMDHAVLAYRVGQVRGTRSSPDMQALLSSLKPGLGAPVERFKSTRRASNQSLHQGLQSFVGGSINDLFKSEVDRASRPRRRGSRLDAPEQADQQSDLLQESLGTTLSRAAVKGIVIKKGKHIFKVEVESGMNLLNTYLKTILPTRATRYTLDDTPTNDAMRVQFQRTAVATYVDSLVVQIYLGLFAHRDPEWECARAAMVDHDSTCSPMEALAALTVSDSARQTIIGDVMLLQYEARREAKLPSNAPSLATLFESLASMGYPRLTQTRSKEPRAKLERILNLMALDLQRVVVTHVDWEPLLRAMAPRFAGRSI